MKINKILATSTMWLIPLALIGGALPARADELVVIVNKANTAEKMTPKQVKNHYMRIQGTWSNGEKVKPVDLPPTAVPRTAFLAKLIGMSNAEFDRYWIEKQYANAETPPMKAPDEAAVINFVGMLKGAIGFVSKETLASSKSESVKAVFTIVE